MNIISIIEKKKNGLELSEDEIIYFIEGFCKEEIKDYQASSLLMAILLKGMSEKETFALTKAMLNSGEQIDLSNIDGVCVDKHSTGGVGDKTSLVLVPMLAASGLKVAKMSGRGLGHTGGTLDKLESIPGFKIAISDEDFKKQVNEIGCAIIAQNKNLVLADKKLYALRDVTATVDSIPLIASSIMSKKLASGAQVILLDVKYGDGAFMKDIDSAKELAELMVKIGENFKRIVKYELSDMNQPLGNAVGNNLEVIEAINTLKGKGPKDLNDLCLESGSVLLSEANKNISKDEALKIMQKVIDDGSAFNKLKDMVKYQHGDVSYIENPDKFIKSKYIYEVKTERNGILNKIQTKNFGLFSCDIGAGRHNLDDIINYATGLILNKKINDQVNNGDILCYIHSDEELNEERIKYVESLFDIK